LTEHLDKSAPRGHGSRIEDSGRVAADGLPDHEESGSISSLAHVAKENLVGMLAFHTCSRIVDINPRRSSFTGTTQITNKSLVHMMTIFHCLLMLISVQQRMMHLTRLQIYQRTQTPDNATFT